MGPLLPPVPVNSKPYITAKKHKVLFDQSNFASASMRQIADSAFEDNRTDVWTDSLLLKEVWPRLHFESRVLLLEIHHVLQFSCTFPWFCCVDNLALPLVAAFCALYLLVHQIDSYRPLTVMG